MDGSALVGQVRKLLRDVETNSSQGEFYSDREIIDALNSGQLIFVNYCLEKKLYIFLQGLIRQSGVIGWNAITFQPFLLSTLNPSYLHIISGIYNEVSSDNNIPRLAQVYIGKNALQYLYVKHYGIYILGDKIYFSQGRDALGNYDIKGQGIILYYTYPYKIYYNPPIPYPADYLLKSWTDDIYENVIANLGASILSLKDSISQRDIKLIQESKTYTNYTTPVLLYLYDIIDTFVESRR